MSYDVRHISQIENKYIKIGKTFKYSLGGTGNDSNLTNIYYMVPNANASSNVSTNASTNVSTNLQPKEIESKRQDAVDDKTKLIIQTPLMYIPNSMIYFNDKPFLELSFNNEDNDKDVSDFKKWIVNLEEYIFKLIKKRTTLGIEKANMCSILKSAYNGNANTNTNTNTNRASRILVPINTNISKCILTDDKKKHKFLFNWEIPVPTYAISIIWIKNIWVKKGKWGLNLFMYASRVMNSHILDPIDFMGIDDNNGISKTNKSIRTIDVLKQFKHDNVNEGNGGNDCNGGDKTSIQIGQMQEYTMFFKMLKLGIPKDAVKQKMSILSLDTRFIDYPDTTPYITVIHYISNPHLGPYVKPSNGNGGSNRNEHATIPSIQNMPGMPSMPGMPMRPNLQLDLLKNISGGGFKLKKVDISKETENDKKSLSSIIKQSQSQKGLKVPSLDDIQGALARLKKIEIDI